MSMPEKGAYAGRLIVEQIGTLPCWVILIGRIEYSNAKERVLGIFW